MEVSEKNVIKQWAARLSDAQLEQAYYDAAYDMADIKELEALEKYQDEVVDLLELLCVDRGIRL